MDYVQSCVVRNKGYSVLVNDQIVEMYSYVYLHKRPSGITAVISSSLSTAFVYILH